MHRTIMKTIVLVPAYGRDYKSAKAAIEDWQAGADWKDALTGSYTSVGESRTLIGMNFTHAELRYRNLSRAALVQIK